MDANAFVQGFTRDGLEIWTLTLPHLRWVGIGMLAFAGHRQDPPGKAGLSHVLEHVVFNADGPLGEARGKEIFASQRGFFIESAGVTDVECVQWAFRGPRVAVESMLTLAAALTRAEPMSFDLEKERMIVLREYHERKVPDLQRLAAFLNGHILPPSHPAIQRESPETVSRIRREDIIQHYRRYYTISNLTLFFVGAITPPEAITAVEATFRPLPHDRGARRSEVPAIGENPGSNRLVVQLNEFFGHRNYVKRDPGMVLSCARPPLMLTTGERRLLKDVVYKVCFELLRQRLHVVYSVEVTHAHFRDVDVYEAGIAFAPDQRAISEEQFLRIPEIVREHGREVFAEAQRYQLLMLELADREVMADLGEAMDEMAGFGQPISDAQYSSELALVTFERIVELADAVFAPERCLVATILP